MILIYFTAKCLEIKEPTIDLTPQTSKVFNVEEKLICYYKDHMYFVEAHDMESLKPKQRVTDTMIDFALR